MKKSLLLFLLPAILLMSCSKSESESTPIESNPGYIIHVKRNTKLSTGELVADYTKAAAIHVWKADGKEFSIASITDGVNGYAYDNFTKSSIKSDYTYVSTSDVTQNVDPGKYFVFVILPEQSNGGSFAYSHKTFEVKKADVITLTKIFGTSTTSLTFQEWDKQD